MEDGLRSCFSNIQKLTSINININLDGIPIYENGTDQFWPILFNIHEMPHISPLIIGIFYGRSKPAKIEEYLSPFVDEAVSILNDGLLINGHLLSVKVRAIICDSPARARYEHFAFVLIFSF